MLLSFGFAVGPPKRHCLTTMVEDGDLTGWTVVDVIVIDQQLSHTMADVALTRSRRSRCFQWS